MKVAMELLKRSGDEGGRALIDQHWGKKDDLCDAILLACGLALELGEVHKKAQKKKNAKNKKLDVASARPLCVKETP